MRSPFKSPTTLPGIPNGAWRTWGGGATLQSADELSEMLTFGQKARLAVAARHRCSGLRRRLVRSVAARSGTRRNGKTNQMIQITKFRSYVAAASLAFYASGCASSQIPSDPQHPASPDAPQAPLPPVGETLAEPSEPQTTEATSPDAHSHESGGAAEATPAATPDGSHDASHAGHSGSVPTPTTAPHTGHGAPASATQADKEAARWTCPMHPEVMQPEPGKCPKCGMKLVPATPKQ
jgi:hypothetical protein